MLLPRQPFKADGEARKREDAIARFKVVWELFASAPERLATFLAMKRSIDRRYK